MTLNTMSLSVKLFKVVAILEGTSFLVLLGIAMPLKYIYGLPETVQIVGMAHGVLFIAYIFMVVVVRGLLNWNMKITALALIASFLPFGAVHSRSEIVKGG